MSCRVRQLSHHNRDQEIHGIGSLRRVEGVSKRSEDVVSVFTRKVTRRVVVADGEGRWLTRVHVAEGIANDSSAADRDRALPHDLREMAPLLEISHVRVGLAVQTIIVAELIVVHQIGDHDSDLVSRNTVSDVLTIATTADVSVMLVDTS